MALLISEYYMELNLECGPMTWVGDFTFTESNWVIYQRFLSYP